MDVPIMLARATRRAGVLLAPRDAAPLVARGALLPIDVSWHMPAAGRAGHAEFIEARLPNARFFDLDACVGPPYELPHMLPSSDDFAATMGSLGVARDTDLLLYDASASGLFSAARLWWTLLGFGHEPTRVHVLDGGLRAWQAAELPLESGEPPAPAARQYAPAPFDADALRDFGAVRAAGERVVDARSAERFNCEVDEPRAGLRRGRLPRSVNVPFGACLRADGSLRAAPELRALFADAGVRDGEPIVFACGSGVTACVAALAAHVSGVDARDVPAIYDGSWTEYGARTDADDNELSLDTPKE